MGVSGTAAGWAAAAVKTSAPTTWTRPRQRHRPPARPRPRPRPLWPQPRPRPWLLRGGDGTLRLSVGNCRLKVTQRRSRLRVAAPGVDVGAAEQGGRNQGFVHPGRFTKAQSCRRRRGKRDQEAHTCTAHGGTPRARPSAAQEGGRLSSGLGGRDNGARRRRHHGLGGGT